MSKNYWAYKALFTLISLLACLLVSSYWFFSQQLKINTNVLALFPDQVFTSLNPNLQDAMLERLDKQVVFLVKDNGDGKAQSAHFLLNALNKLECFSSILGHIDEQNFNKIGKFYFEHKEALLDSKSRALLQNEEQFLAYLQAQIFSSFSGISAQEINHDPLMLTRAIQMNNLSATGSLSIYQQFLAANYQDSTYYFLVGQLKSAAFDLESGAQLVANFTKIKQELKEHYPNSELLWRGTVFYNHSAANLAKHDITYLGLSSIILMFLLMFVAYRSLWPLGLAIFSIGSGALVGFTISAWLFDSVHIITLLISLSIIGISADYTIYFCSLVLALGMDNFTKERQTNLNKVLLISLATTLASYVLMTLAPFPIIKQICVFAISGLVASCMVVITLYPCGVSFFNHKSRTLIGASKLTLVLSSFKSHKVKLIYSSLFLALIALGLPKLHMDHDIAKLQALDSSLKEQDQRIAAITGQSADQNWLVVSADHEEQLLERANKVYEELSQDQSQDKIGSFTRLPLITKAQQLENFALIESLYPVVKEFYLNLGMTFDDHSAMASFDKDKLKVLSLNDFLSSPASMGFSLMVFALPSQDMALLIPINDIKDKSYLKELSLSMEGLHYIDRKSDFSAVFEHCSSLLLMVLALSLLVVALSSILRHGIKLGLFFLTPSLGAVGMSYAALGLLGMEANMFAILASLLVLGISVNYSIFNSHSDLDMQVTTQWSITMAMLTTVITLGVLVFSSTYAVTVFGMSLLFGIGTAYMLSPLAQRANYGIHQE